MDSINNYISYDVHGYWKTRVRAKYKSGASHPAMMAPTAEKNHSAELNPSIATPWNRSKPSCKHQQQHCLFSFETFKTLKVSLCIFCRGEVFIMYSVPL